MSVSALAIAPWRIRLCRLIAWVALSFVAATGHAVTFVVNTTADTADAVPGDGICSDSSNACSLRAAVQEANALPGPDTIQLGRGSRRARAARMARSTGGKDRRGMSS